MDMDVISRLYTVLVIDTCWACSAQCFSAVCMRVQPTLPSVFGTGDLVDDARMLREYAAKAAESIESALDKLKTKPKVCPL
jgi:hypothetical protein